MSTNVDKDLAALRQAVGSAIAWGATHGITESPDYARWNAALTCVEAELSRLRREVDDKHGMMRVAIKDAEAAEARCAAMEECDCIPFSFSSKACPKCGRRDVVSDKTVSRFLIERNEFEARCARLQEKLDESYRYRDMYGETIERQRGEITRLQQALAPIVALVRIGFLVTVNGHRADTDVVKDPTTRAMLFTILQAKDTAAAVEALAGPDTPADSQPEEPSGELNSG